MGQKEQLTDALQKAVEKSLWPKAIEALEGLLTLDPANATHRLRIGDYHLKLNNKTKAAEEYTRAAEMFTAAGSAVKAMAVYKMILRLDPKAEKATAALQALKPPTRSAGDRPEGGGPSARETFKEKRVMMLFATLTQDEFNAMVERMQPPQEFAPGAVLVQEGTESNHSLFIITRGKVKVTTMREGQEKTLGLLKENDFFGEVTYFTKGKRTASITAIQETEVLELKEEDLTALTQQHPHMGDVLQEFHQTRLQQAQGQPAGPAESA